MGCNVKHIVAGLLPEIEDLLDLLAVCKLQALSLENNNCLHLLDLITLIAARSPFANAEIPNAPKDDSRNVSALH
jgi:hypothetical protein